jgi:hypothetical protein
MHFLHNYDVPKRHGFPDAQTDGTGGRRERRPIRPWKEE